MKAKICGLSALALPTVAHAMFIGSADIHANVFANDGTTVVNPIVYANPVGSYDEVVSAATSHDYGEFTVAASASSHITYSADQSAGLITGSITWDTAAGLPFAGASSFSLIAARFDLTTSYSYSLSVIASESSRTRMASSFPPPCSATCY